VREVLGQQDLNGLIEYYKDRYDPAELVDHLNIPLDDLITFVEEWIKDNQQNETVQEDLEHITNFEEDI
jgi:hypothetical protein